MKKGLVLGVLVIALAGGAFWLLSSEGEAPAPQQESSSEQQTTNSQTPAGQSSNQDGQYVNYSTSALAEAEGTKILFFHASWCPQCRALESDIKDSGLPSGVTVFKVNYDTATDLKKKYGVTLQTTLVKVDDQGNLVEKFVAYDDPSVDSLKENLL